MRAVEALLFAFILLLVGCTSSPKDEDCQGEDCIVSSPAPSTPTIPMPTDFPIPSLPVNETLRSMKFENCTGLAGTMQLPKDRVAAVVPTKDFELVEEVQAAVLLEALQCQRLVVAGKVLENYLEFTIAPKVRPRNESWSPTYAAHFFFLERFVSHEEVAKQYRDWGTPASQAGFEVGNLAGTESPTTAWKVQNGSIKFAFEYVVSNHPANPGNLTNHHWIGPDPYLRATIELDKTTDSAFQLGTLKMEGPSKTATLVGAPAAQYDAFPTLSFMGSKVVEPDLFYGVKP